MKIFELLIDYCLHGFQMDLEASNEFIFFFCPLNAVLMIDNILQHLVPFFDIITNNSVDLDLCLIKILKGLASFPRVYEEFNLIKYGF